MSRPELVFLLCSERSGSNLIRAMMDAHPEIAAPQPLHLVRDVLSRADAVEYGTEGSAEAEALLAELRARLTKQLPTGQAEPVIARVDAVTRFEPRALMQALYLGLAEASGANLVFVKENELRYAAAQIIDAFPDARFLFQVRDPRDYLASGKALRAGWFTSKFGSFRNAMQIWHEDQRFGLNLLGHFGPDRVHFQRYEDLVSDPEAVLRNACAFLKRDYAPEMIEFYQREREMGPSNRIKAWRNLRQPVMSDNFDKYKMELSSREIAAVEASVGPLMDRFGYRRDAARTGRGALVWPSLVEPIERLRNEAWSPFFTANADHHDRLDAVARGVALPYLAGATTRSFKPGRMPRRAPERALQSALEHPAREALRVGGESWSYDRLFGAAAAAAEGLGDGDAPVGVFAARHASSYIGILGTLLAGGRAYVPLNCRFPPARNRKMAERSGMRTLLYGAEFESAVREILAGTDIQGVRIDLDAAPLSAQSWAPRPSSYDEVAYILFTSGSTGEPKGVAIRHGSLAAYLEQAIAALKPSQDDRFSQTFDLTFDLSVHDMFVAWSAGAALCVPSLSELNDPAAFLQNHEITQWFCVPSLGYTIRQTGKLLPGAFPSLKVSLFCGEALPSDLARDWVAASPNGRTENWYGPTEATIACLRHDVADDAGAAVAPLGRPFPGVEAVVVDSDGRPVAPGETGALHLGGAQVAGGYLNDPERTARAFVALPGRAGRYYDTGDLASVRDGAFHFHGRRDFQVKIRGYRVELGEIEAALRDQADGRNVTALTWPPGAPNATHVVAAIETPEPRPALDRKALGERLPDYMLPSSAFGVAPFPRNASGKVDRGALVKAIETRIAADQRAGDGSISDRVMSLILQVKPTLGIDDVTSAENLFLAGLDSLDFVNLTALFEEQLGVQLTEDYVAAMANLSFGDLAAVLERGQDGVVEFERTLQKRVVRANRARMFVKEFPAFVRGASAPLMIAFGTSGTFRGFDTEQARAALRAAGLDMRVVNAGLPALSISSLARMARFVRDECAGARVGGVLHELDPMLVSVSPPKGEIDIDEAFFRVSAQETRPSGETVEELTWSPVSGGSMTTSLIKAASVKRPDWQEARNRVVVETYRGETAFNPAAMQAWVAASDALTDMGAPVLGWVHPLVDGQTGGGAFDRMLAELRAATGAMVAPPEALSASAEHFVDLNHVSSGAGSAELTRSLIELFVAEATAETRV